MANRHLKGETNEILVPVRGKTVVESGDLIYRNTFDSNYCAPFSYSYDSTSAMSQQTILYQNFMGVAMEASLSGTTENVSVATNGVFMFPISPGVSAVTAGGLVSAATVTNGSAGSAAVVVNSGSVVNGTTAYLGRLVETNSSGTSMAKFQLRSLTGDGGLIPQ